MINLVSLGMSCQTTHQLSLFALNNPQLVQMIKCPFDWLICPPASCVAWLEEDLRKFVTEEIVEFRQHAYWPYFDFWFWHGFINRAMDVPVLDIKGLGHQELSKHDYLSQRFRRLDISRTLFFLSNTQNNLDVEVFTPAEMQRYHFNETNTDKLQLAMNHFFCKPVKLHVATRVDRATQGLRARENVHTLELDHSNWKGSKEQWSALLSRLLAAWEES